MDAAFGKDFILSLLLGIPPFLLAITVHEFAHGYLAYRKGDHTASLQGRLTLNPLRHIDPIGTVLFPLMLIVVRSPVIFGWAKPVPVNPYNFRNPRKDNMIVALAGPASNILLALVLAFCYRLLLWYPGSAAVTSSTLLFPLVMMVLSGLQISLYLAVFNLIPVHPLDGSHILEGLLPADKALAYHRLAPYGFIILIALLYTRVFDLVVHPVYRLLWRGIQVLLGL